MLYLSDFFGNNLKLLLAESSKLEFQSQLMLVFQQQYINNKKNCCLVQRKKDKDFNNLGLTFEIY